MDPREREQLIRLAVLRILRDCGDYLLPENTLRIHADMAIPNLLRSELDTELRWLEAQRFVTAVRPDLGGPPKWKITDLGRATLNA